MEILILKGVATLANVGVGGASLLMSHQAAKQDPQRWRKEIKALRGVAILSLVNLAAILA